MATEDAILGVISLYPCSGYDIKVEFEKGGAGLLSALSFGSIYPKLKQLELEGLIETKQTNTGDRQKKIHDLTAEGWQRLAQWLAIPTDFPLPMRDELLLKMLFWGAGLPDDRSTLIEHLRYRRTCANELLTYLTEWSMNGHSFIDEYGMLVLEYMRSRLEVELKWITMAIAQLEGPPRPPVQDPQGFVLQQQERRATALDQEHI